jgi:hypothetical protein
LQEVIAQEMKKRRVKDKDHEGLTSVHHIAAEVTIRKMKRIILMKRLSLYLKENGLIPQNVSVLKKNKSLLNTLEKTSFGKFCFK